MRTLFPFTTPRRMLAAGLFAMALAGGTVRGQGTPRGQGAPRAYPDPIPADVSFDKVVASQPYPAMRYPVPIVGWKHYPEEIHVTPTGALVFPRPDDQRRLYLAPLIGNSVTETPSILSATRLDRGLVDGYKPGIRSAWNAGGLVIKQTVFGTLMDADEVRTGRETLVGLCRWTISNPNAHSRTAHLWLNFGAAAPGHSLLAPAPAYGGRLSYRAPFVLEPDGTVAAAILTPGLEVTFHPRPDELEQDASRFLALNADERTVEGPDFEIPVRREGDRITVGAWSSGSGVDLVFEASRIHGSATAMDVTVRGTGGYSATVGKLFRTGLSREMRPEADWIAPGQSSASVPWSALKDAIPQGESRIVLSAYYPTPEGPKRPFRWEPIAYLTAPGAGPTFKAPAPGDPRENSLRVEVTLAPGASRSFDVVVPYFPLAEGKAAALRGLDYEARLAAFRAYWGRELNRNARFDIPEKRIRDAYRACLAYNLLLTDLNPETGRLEMHPDPNGYEYVWAGDGGVIVHAMDRLGYHAEAARYLDFFPPLQGTRRPRGDVMVHRGFFTGNSPNWWINENGFVLWAMAEHYKLTRDEAWLHRVAPAMVASADWIVRHRNRTKTVENGWKPRHYGLLSQGSPSDLEQWDYWYWSDTYSYMGLRGIADVLGKIGMAKEAARYDAEARDYRACILASLERSINRDVTPPFVPPSPYWQGPPTADFVFANWYSLSSPIYMVEAGIFEATDPKATWTDAWLEKHGLYTGLPSFGPTHVDPHYVYNQSLAHLLRGEAGKFLWTFYSLFAYGQSRSTYATIETINLLQGMSGEAWDANRQPHMHSNSRVLAMVRIALLLEEREKLHLLAGTPTGWLAPGQTLAVHDAPTEFGNAGLTARSVAGRREVRFRITPPTQTAADLVLHVRPPEAYGKIRSVTVNGKPWPAFSAREVRLGRRTTRTDVVCRF